MLDLGRNLMDEGRLEPWGAWTDWLKNAKKVIDLWTFAMPICDTFVGQHLGGQGHGFRP